MEVDAERQLAAARAFVARAVVAEGIVAAALDVAAEAAVVANAVVVNAASAVVVEQKPPRRLKPRSRSMMPPSSTSFSILRICVRKLARTRPT